MGIPKKIDIDLDLNHGKIEEKIIRLDGFLWKKYPKLGDGAYRSVFDMGNGKVLKCPLPDSMGEDAFDNGVRANIIEYFFYKKFKRHKIMPETTLVWRRGIPLIIMDKVEPIFDSNMQDDFIDKLDKDLEIELWDGYRQLGLDKDDRVVCYDLGNEDELLTENDRKRIDRMTLEVLYKLSQKKKRKKIKKQLTF